MRAFARLMNSPIPMTEIQQKQAQAIHNIDIEPNPNEPEVVSGHVIAYIKSFRALLTSLIGNSARATNLYTVNAWRSVALPQDILAQKERVRKDPQALLETVKLNRMLVLFVIGVSGNRHSVDPANSLRQRSYNAAPGYGTLHALESGRAGSFSADWRRRPGGTAGRYRLHDDGTLERPFSDNVGARDASYVFVALRRAGYAWTRGPGRKGALRLLGETRFRLSKALLPRNARPVKPRWRCCLKSIHSGTTGEFSLRQRWFRTPLRITTRWWLR